MDVEDPAAPLLDKPRGEDAHESGQRDRSDVVVVKRGAERAVEPLLLDALAVPGPSRKTLRPCPVESGGVRLVRGDQHHLVATRPLNQSAHVAATSGDED